jgi:hypothetical protein
MESDALACRYRRWVISPKQRVHREVDGGTVAQRSTNVLAAIDEGATRRSRLGSS